VSASKNLLANFEIRNKSYSEILAVFDLRNAGTDDLLSFLEVRNQGISSLLASFDARNRGQSEILAEFILRNADFEEILAEFVLRNRAEVDHGPDVFGVRNRGSKRIAVFTIVRNKDSKNVKTFEVVRNRATKRIKACMIIQNEGIGNLSSLLYVVAGRKDQGLTQEAYIERYEQMVEEPEVFVLDIPKQNTEYEFPIPIGTKKFLVRERSNNLLRLAFRTGHVAGAVDPYFSITTIPYEEDDVFLWNKRLFIAADADSRKAEIRIWK